MDWSKPGTEIFSPERISVAVKPGVRSSTTMARLVRETTRKEAASGRP